jgi:hypothetical protein
VAHIIIGKEFDKPNPKVKPGRGKANKERLRELSPNMEVSPSSGLILPSDVIEESELVAAKHGNAGIKLLLDIATGRKARGEDRTRRARWKVLQFCASTLPAPALVKDEHGNIIRNDGEASKDYGTMDLHGAIRLLMGAGYVEP